LFEKSIDTEKNVSGAIIQETTGALPPFL